MLASGICPLQGPIPANTTRNGKTIQNALSASAYRTRSPTPELASAASARYLTRSTTVNRRERSAGCAETRRDGAMCWLFDAINNLAPVVGAGLTALALLVAQRLPRRLGGLRAGGA